MRSSQAFRDLSVVLLFLAVGAVSSMTPGAGQSPSALDAVIAEGAGTDLAVQLALDRISAGFVLAEPAGGADPAAGPFENWAAGRRPGLRRSGATRSRGTDEALRQFAARNRLVYEDQASLRFTDGAATACRTMLARTIPDAIEAKDPFEAASRVTGVLPGGKPWKGAAGSCLPVQLTEGEQRLFIAARTSLADALDAIGTGYRGIVWVALDSGKGHCSIALFLAEADTDRVCRMDVLKRRSVLPTQR